MKILKVVKLNGKEVKGYLYDGWNLPMQVVFTDSGIFIDGEVGKSQFSHPKGHDWNKEIGRTLDKRHFVLRPCKQAQHTWINTHK